MASLPFSTYTRNGESREFQFPLHPLTRSPEDVGEIASAVLRAVSEVLDSKDQASDGDVLQGLCIALGIRAHMVKAEFETTRALVLEVLEDTMRAAEQGQSRPAGRA